VPPSSMTKHAMTLSMTLLHAVPQIGCSTRRVVLADARFEQATLLYIGVRIGGVWPHILPWAVAAVAPQGPRREKTPADQRIEADFRLVAHEVLAEPETDDPVEIEARTDRAITNLTGFKAPGR